MSRKDANEGHLTSCKTPERLIAARGVRNVTGAASLFTIWHMNHVVEYEHRRASYRWSGKRQGWEPRTAGQVFGWFMRKNRTFSSTGALPPTSVPMSVRTACAYGNIPSASVAYSFSVFTRPRFWVRKVRFFRSDGPFSCPGWRVRAPHRLRDARCCA